MLADWETGNEEFAELYEAGMMNLVRTGYYDDIFAYWNITYYTFQDCLPQGGFHIYEAISGFSVETCKVTSLDYTGTASKVLNNCEVHIGTIQWDVMPLYNTTDPTQPRGILTTLEKQIFSWYGNVN